MTPREPTADECSSRALIHEDEAAWYYALWYPQMGGYVGKAVAEIAKQRVEMNDGWVTCGGCVDVLVWHDGEFPFSGTQEPGVRPVRIHHCDPDQFIDFGQALKDMMNGQAVSEL
jgi:hypothetical protein